MTTASDALVTTAWLADHLDDPDLRVLDASWYLPQQNRDAKAEFAAARLPGAQFFDIDAIADTSVPLPHMLPDERTFADAVGALGIGAGDMVVVYDGAGIFSAPRAWWEFRTFGHDRVAVLDGGLPKWRGEGRRLETGAPAAPRRPSRPFVARLDRGVVRDLAAMRDNVAAHREQAVDARSAGRFHALEPEARPGLRSGHIPGAANLPYTRLVDPASGTFVSVPAVREAFATAGVDLERPVVTSCGSGITAAILSLGLHLSGHHDNALYDGSWVEWGGRTDTPIET